MWNGKRRAISNVWETKFGLVQFNLQLKKYKYISKVLQSKINPP